MNIREVFTKIIGRVLEKYNSYSLQTRIISFYAVFAGIFLYYHESHLPVWLALALTISSIVLSIVTLELSLYIIRFMFHEDFRLLPEVIYIITLTVILYFFGLFDYGGMPLFLFIIAIIFVFVRIMQFSVYYRIILFGLAILVNGLVSFRYIQAGEILLMRYSLKDRYGSEELDLSKWEFNDQTRNLSNSTIKLELTIPEGLNFHNPKDLKMREKTGSGQIAGIISFSNTNPNSYPYIRIFYIPQFVKVDISTIREEYLRVMEFEKNQGEIEEIRELGERTFQTKNWKGNFWTFYDILRPRYSKRGFYIVEREDGTSLVLDLCENLVKGQEHEDIIKNLLESVK